MHDVMQFSCDKSVIDGDGGDEQRRLFVG